VLLLLIAAGPAVLLSSSGLTKLAAAHPAAYFRLVDCCVRSSHFKAADVLAAADLIRHASAPLHGSQAEAAALLADAAAVTAYLSAVSTVVKRAAMLTKAAGSTHAEAQQATSSGRGRGMSGQQQAAAQYFPALAPLLFNVLLGSIEAGITHMAMQLFFETTSSISSSSSSSCGSINQCRASAMLLAVLVARSLVVLADAMEAAAAAAGMAPEQLFARCGG
jgi:hypothetical protein